MPSTLQISLLIVVIVGLFIAALRAPNWFSRSLAIYALWRLRDDVVDSILDAQLPEDHPAVHELVNYAEWVTEDRSALTIREFYVWSWTWRKAIAKLDASSRGWHSLDGLDAEQRELLTAYRERLVMASTAALLFGSWLGIATVISCIIPALAQERRDRRCKDDPPRLDGELKDTIWLATDIAITDTWVGRRSRDFVGEPGHGRLSGVT
jgi:hypothetical protein